jgi:polar amino acid transport system substrate-binding protein
MLHRISALFPLGVALVVLLPLPARAQQTAAPTVGTATSLRIGIFDDPPFATHEAGQWHGLSTEIWNAVAARAGFSIAWVPVTRADLAQQLAARKIDIGPALTITADRMREMDFTPPILASGIAIATIEERSWDWRAMLLNLWSSGLFKVVGGIVLANLLIGFLLWRLEHRQNPANFGGDKGQGFASGIWCSVSTMTNVGYGDKVPITWPGRLLCFVLMLSGVIVISLFTAAATSALTVAHLRPRVHNADDLKHVVSVAIKGSAGAQYLERHAMPVVSVPDTPTALTTLAHGKVSAFVHNRIELRASFKGHAGYVAILPISLEEDFYAFPVSLEPALRHQVNVALQEFLDSTDWDRIEASYLGD